MMSWAFFAIGCVAPDVGGDAADSGSDTPLDSQADTAIPLVELPEIPDAVDLDPAEGSVRVSLTAERLDHEVGGVVYPGYGYNGMSPGPTIRANVGDTVTVEFANLLDDPTTVHWHGLSVPNAMDGAAWIDSPVPAAGGFTYQFVVDRPGTFWYHPHLDVSRQVDLGLYGALVVADAAEPAADRDLVVVMDAWAEFNEDDPDHHELPPDPNSVVWTVNGVVDPVLTLADGERARIRALNASNTSYLSLDWPGAMQIAGDQGLLAAASAAAEVKLAPGNRAEFEVDAGEMGDLSTQMWSAAGGSAFGDPRTLLSIAQSGTSSPITWPFAGVGPSAEPTFTDLVYVFAGGGSEGSWLLNGEAWPDVTASEVALGTSAIIEVRNISESSHPFHMHGHRFEVLSLDGVPPALATWADTLDVPIRSRVRLKLVADNPGEWLLHCHLLGHEDGGMMTLLNVQ